MQTLVGSYAPLLVCLAGLTVIFCVIRECRRSVMYRSWEDALRARESQLHLSMRVSNEGHWQWSVRSGELQLSARVYELLGYEPVDALTTFAFFRSIVHSEDYRASRRRVLRHLRARKEFTVDYRLRHKWGGYRWFHLRGQFAREDLDATAAIGSIVDITDQKRAEEISRHHALQHGLTAELGQMALKCEDIGTLMRFAVSIVNRGLDCEFCRLLSRDVDDKVLVLRGASGWNEEWSRRLRFDAIEETEERFIEGVRNAIIVDDFWGERRIKASDMLRAHGIRSAAEIQIRGVQEAYGVLGVYSRKARQFTRENLIFLLGVSNILASCIDRFQAQDKLTQQELLSRESEERLRKITDNLPAMIAYWDHAGTCRFANRAHTRNFGPEFDSAREAQAAVMNGLRQRFDIRSQLADGTAQHWQAEYLPHWSHGEVVGFYALIVDITERKTAEERLVRQEALLSATGRMGEIGGWEQDLGQSVPRLSDMACRIHDLPPGATPDIDTWEKFYPPESLKTVRRSIADAFDFGKAFDYLVPFLSAAGRQRWVRSIGEPQMLAGRCVRIVGAIQDVTQQKRLENDLAQSQKLESIGQLAAGIAHEINTPTQFIGNNVGFLSDSVEEIFAVLRGIQATLDHGATSVSVEDLLKTFQRVDMPYLLEEIPLAIKQAQEGIERIQKIVGAMKEFSHPSMEKTLVDINRAIGSTIIVASNEWKYVAEMVTELDPNLPSVCVMPGSFNQVILNLIVNAAHAIGDVIDRGLGAKGVITIRTRRVDDWAEVSVHDTGCGIPEKIRDRIFDPFFTTKPVGKGTGQGLAIAHDMVVNKHGGAIAVESKVGNGTAFILRLPLGQDTAAGIAARA